MSAFVVEDKTINTVITFIASNRRGDLAFYKDKIKDLGFDLDTQEGREKCGGEMFRLNVQAVTTRYKGRAEDFREMNYRFSLEGSGISKYQALKSMKCWLYQCNEGDVPEAELFKVIDQASDSLAYNIASRTPEYEAAEWR